MRWLSISALIVASACNALLGLDSTIGDRDGDGIPDETDNCPDLPNTDQTDFDGNGVGDACTICATPIGRDLDDDGSDDGCDRCIGPGPIGVDSDGDGLDDGCDPCLGGTGVTGETENIGGVGTLGRDDNGDGIDDGCTVCFHPRGEDVDNDGLDDDCDLCLAGPPHDEDGDGDPDGCDNCPGDVDPDQRLDTDLTIGAICDAELASTRVLFDPFLVESESWLPSSGFMVADDRLHADSIGAGGPITRTSIGVFVHQHFRIALGIAAHDGDVGFNLKDMDPGGLDLSCTLQADGFVRVSSGLESATSGDKLVVDDETVPIQLVADARNGFSGNTIACQATSGENLARATVVNGLSDAGILQIEVDGTAELTYIDAVGQQP